MKIDSGLGVDLAHAGAAARTAEDVGFDGLWVPETTHDPFLPLTVAAEHTNRIELGTSIAVAFARSPMTTAYTAYDLAAFSHGRFILGLGSQIKPHITKRFAMEWSRPAARMREFVLALRAIWDCWMNQAELDFHGDFYTHTLMTPFFDPGPHDHGIPRVFLAGVGPRMTEVAGEVGDGFFCHGFSTERYLRQVTLPALRAGRAKVGKTMDGFEICGPSFVATGTTEEEIEGAKANIRGQIAFYGSTPAYRAVLDCHGWGEMQTELHSLAKQGRWAEMGALVDDEILTTFAVVGSPGEIGPQLRARYGDIVSRVVLTTSNHDDPDRDRDLLAAVRN